jgi:hypothetical protein
VDRIGNTNKGKRVVENPVQRYHFLSSNNLEDDVTKEYRERVCIEGRST